MGGALVVLLSAVVLGSGGESTSSEFAGGSGGSLTSSTLSEMRLLEGVYFIFTYLNRVSLDRLLRVLEFWAWVSCNHEFHLLRFLLQLHNHLCSRDICLFLLCIARNKPLSIPLSLIENSYFAFMQAFGA